VSGETFLQLAQLSTILVGFLGVGVTLRNHRRQMHAQMFIEFSSRFHDVLRALPLQTMISNGAPAESVPPQSESLTRSCLQCFHVIAEIHHLHRTGYIPQDLWRPCQRVIKRSIRSPLLRREWQNLEPAFEHNPELCRFIHALIADKPQIPAWRRSILK
jgi:hypothetical protein